MFLDYLRISYAYVIPPVLGFIILISLALISLLRTRKNPTNILFAAICVLGALINIDVALVSIIPDEALALNVDRMTYLFFVFSLPVYIRFVHTFLGITRRGWLEWIAYLFTLSLLPFVLTDYFIAGFYHYDFGPVAKGGPIFHVFSLAAALTVVYCLSTLFLGMKRAKDNRQKNRIKYILGGTGITALLISLNILPVSGLNVYPMSNFSFISVIFLSFGVLKYDLLDIGVVIRRGSIYFILTGILTILYVLIIYLFNTFFMVAGKKTTVVLPFVLAVLIVFIFNPLKVRVQALIDKLLFKGKYDYHKLVKEVSGELTSLLKFSQIKDLLIRTLCEALQVSRVCMLMYSEQKGCFELYENGGDCTAIFVRNHPIVTYLERSKKPLGRSAVTRRLIPGGKRDEIVHVFDMTKASLIVPMVSKGQLLGLITLGQKKSGELFVDEDIELLTTIANQGAISIENARIYGEIEQMNLALEKKVEKRTAALRLALDDREKAYKKLIQSESLAAVGQLVAGTAHELNNPLASASSLIQTSLERIVEWKAKEEDHEEVLDDLSFSVKELKRAGDIVRSLLDISRQTQTYVEPVSLNVAIDDALRVLYNQYKYLDVAFEKIYEDNLPEVEGNFANLGQVFINVIKNALQALPAGKGQITLLTHHCRETDSVMAVCRDTGRGIPEDQLKDIFKPFFTTKEVGKGTGLGLYISYEIIKKHGGNIVVSSTVGNGSTVTIELPCRRREQ